MNCTRVHRINNALNSRRRHVDCSVRAVLYTAPADIPVTQRSNIPPHLHLHHLGRHLDQIRKVSDTACEVTTKNVICLACCRGIVRSSYNGRIVCINICGPQSFHAQSCILFSRSISAYPNEIDESKTYVFLSSVKLKIISARGSAYVKPGRTRKCGPQRR